MVPLVSKRDPLAISEAAFQWRVREYAQMAGWRSFSLPDSRRVTARGWPDEVFARPADKAKGQPLRLAYIEFKTGSGRTRPEQVEWLDMLAAVAKHANATAGYEMVFVGIWRPRFWPEIQDYLDGKDWPKEKTA